ncbi:MAG: PelD GGDEF domain-containing protein [Desulfuromonadaceae bacterium]|nr:PelD GGDEF domain-containing protein [Desulfuromonadaceae bacterium]
MKLFTAITVRFPNIVGWLETVALTLLTPLAGYLLNRADPFFVQAAFPWLWFGPLLVALRYGVAPALSSVSLLVLLWFAASYSGLINALFPLHFMLGGTLLTLIAGQFSSVWATKLRRSELLSGHASERFEQLSRAYFVVRHSHDQLEQNLIMRPVTLRQAIVELRDLLTGGDGAISHELAQELLILLTHYCSLSSAAIYAMHNGVPDAMPLAQCGQGAPLRENDLLLRSAIESRHTAYQAANRLNDEDQSCYLVAAPIRTSSGCLLGVLLVTDMPFMALHRESLQILAVLLAYAADNVEAAGIARILITVYSDCPAVFGTELVKMTRLKRELDISSTLVVINLSPGPRRDELCLLLERQLRGLDHSWRRDIGWSVQFVTLMPFAGTASAEGYQTRLDTMLKKQFQMSLQSPGISCKHTLVSGEEPIHQLANLLAEDV